MKIIFLDIDGVVNTHESIYEKTYSDIKIKTLPSGKEFHEHLSHYSIRVLNDIIKETDAKVVVSSSWRLIYSIDDIKYILNIYGFEGEVIDITPKIVSENRGYEIKTWINNYEDNIESYLVLDDDCDMKGVLDGFLWIRRSKGHFGLSLYHIERAIKILNNKFKFKFNGIYNRIILIKPSIGRFIFYKKLMLRDVIKSMSEYKNFMKEENNE